LKVSLTKQGIISPKLHWRNGHTTEQSLAVSRGLALSDVVDEYDAATRTFPVRGRAYEVSWQRQCCRAYQGKGSGESSNTPVAATIATAVCDAVGVRIMDVPLTAEQVFVALQARRVG